MNGGTTAAPDAASLLPAPAKVELVDFERLFEEHHVHLVRFAGLLTGSNDQAQDIVADVFARLMRRPPGHMEDQSAYLRRCVVNEVNSVGRRFARRSRLGASANPPSSQPMIDGPIAERDRIARALAELPRQQRAVLVLRYFEDLSEAQTAALLRVPAGTVKSASSRGATRLRELLREDHP